MPWTDSVLEIIKKEFGNEPFLVDEAVKVLEKNANYSKTAIRQALFQLVKEGFLAHLAKELFFISFVVIL